MKEVEEEGQKEQKVSWSFWRFLLRRKQATPGEFLCQCYNPCKGSPGKAPEGQGQAHMGVPEHADAILKQSELVHPCNFDVMFVGLVA